jgi:G3E family GTPase
MQPTRLIFVGGFLGAGKTTLLWEAARRLAARGQCVGLITNDQAPNLVDTGLLAQQGFEVSEVTGSCFCCNFNALIDAAFTLKSDIHADVLIGEPVGSCTDLSATILQPLKDRYREEFVLTPLSVLADPTRIRQVLSGDPAALHPDAAYIYRKQLEEADVIVVNKVDLLSAVNHAALRALIADQFPGQPLRFISAQTGEGVDEWIDAVLAGSAAGERLAAVDYDRYARGEAVLGWLNATCDLSAATDTVDWQRFCRELLESLREEFVKRRAAVGHVKIMLSTPHGA